MCPLSASPAATIARGAASLCGGRKSLNSLTSGDLPICQRSRKQRQEAKRHAKANGMGRKFRACSARRCASIRPGVWTRRPRCTAKSWRRSRQCRTPCICWAWSRCRQGQAQTAAELTRKAIAINGREAPYHFHLAARPADHGRHGRRGGQLSPRPGARSRTIPTPTTIWAMRWRRRTGWRRRWLLSAARWPSSPTMPWRINNLGNVQWSMGQRDEAEASFRKAVALQPDYAGALINLGNLHRATRPISTRRENCYRRALALAPQSAAAHCSLGLALWNLGRRDEAMASYQEALALRSRSCRSAGQSGHRAVGEWRAGRGRSPLRAALWPLRPGDPDLLNNFAALAHGAGRWRPRRWR